MARTSIRALLRQLSRHRTIRVTTEGIRFLLLTLAVGIAAVNTGNNLFYLLLAMMLSLKVQDINGRRYGQISVNEEHMAQTLNELMNRLDMPEKTIAVQVEVNASR